MKVRDERSYLVPETEFSQSTARGNSHADPENKPPEVLQIWVRKLFLKMLFDETLLWGGDTIFDALCNKQSVFPFAGDSGRGLTSRQ